MYAGAKALSSRSINTLGNNPAAYGLKHEVEIKPFTSTKWPHRLSFYDRPPDEEMTVDEFESWAIDRLRREL